jgi:hypothetical protein
MTDQAPPNPPAQPPAPPPGLYPPQGYGQPGQYAQPVPPSNGIGTAAGVVGIIALVLLWFPYIGLILGVLGVVLGAVGLSRSNRLYGAGKGMSIAGIACGAVALVVNILFIAAIYTAVGTVH